MRKLKQFLFLLIAFSTLSAYGQRIELELLAGGSTYLGDLAPSSAIGSLTEFHPAFSLSVGTCFCDWGAARLTFSQAKITGDDANADDFFRRRRNLSFRTNISEIAFLLEARPFGHITVGDIGNSLTPYLFGGIAGYRFNPKAELRGEWYELQPLTTEGQETSVFPDKEKYQLTQLAIPFGVGVRFKFLYYYNIGLEIGFRNTFTDYLDDVSSEYVDEKILLNERGEISAQLANRSEEFLLDPIDYPTGTQRGDMDDKDWYIIGGLTLGIDLVDRKYRNDLTRAGKLRCPGW